MKKIILSIAVVLASMTGFSAIAQPPDDNATQPTTESTKRPPKTNTPRYNPFAGLNLSETQQSELQALRPSKEAKKQNKDKKDDVKNMTTAEKQALRKQRAENRIQNRRDYLDKVKNILTPNQYMQFLENSYVEQGVNGKNKVSNNKRHANNKAQAMRGGKNNVKGRKAKGNGMYAKNAGYQSAANQSDSTYYIDNGLIKVFPYHAQR